MAIKLTTIWNWDSILGTLVESKYIDQLKRRMIKGLKKNLKQNAPNMKIVLKIKDSDKIDYMQYIIEKYPITKKDLMFSVKQRIVENIVKNFVKRLVAVILNKFLKDMGVVN